ncbi:GNAT family N-acetyltransferase [Rubrimonas cliftonensis]|nr:GNAT family N-acetyltransferase [Rubrimonas cliftonensis]
MTERRRRHGGVFRELWSLDWVHYTAHLKRLSPEDRVSRFHGVVRDHRIEAHAREALRRPGRVLGWFDGGTLRAAAEVAFAPGETEAEAAFEVEQSYRGRGVGTELVARTLLWSRNRGVRRLLIHTTRRNLPMLRAAQANGAAFEFDIADAEGVIAAEAPNLLSHTAEAMQALEDAWRWSLRRFGGGGMAPFL